jgi:hypothetical protein
MKGPLTRKGRWPLVDLYPLRLAIVCKDADGDEYADRKQLSVLSALLNATRRFLWASVMRYRDGLEWSYVVMHYEGLQDRVYDVVPLRKVETLNNV